MSQIDIEQLTSRRSSERFPNFVVDSPNDTIPVVVRCLEQGDYQLIVELGEKRKVVANISLSAYNVGKLLRCVGSITFRKSRELSYRINNVTEYLECV